MNLSEDHYSRNGREVPFSYPVTFVILTVDNIHKYLIRSIGFSDIYEHYPQVQTSVRCYEHLKAEQTLAVWIMKNFVLHRKDPVI